MDIKSISERASQGRQIDSSTGRLSSLMGAKIYELLTGMFLIQLFLRFFMESKTKEKTKVNIFQMQVGGIRPKLVTADKTTVMKKMNPSQLSFYRYIHSLRMSDISYGLVDFLPKFLGVIEAIYLDIQVDDMVQEGPAEEWIRWKKALLLEELYTQQYLMLRNFTYGLNRPNVMDIKLGAKRIRQQSAKQKVGSIHHFQMHGFSANFRSDPQLQLNHYQQKRTFLSKYTFESLPKDDQTILYHLALFFFDGQLIRTAVLQTTIQKLKRLILSIKCLHSWKLVSTSICIYYESGKDAIVDMKLVDFERSSFTGTFESDEITTIQGLENLHQFLVMILSEYHQESTITRLKVLAKRYVEDKLYLVPSHSAK